MPYDRQAAVDYARRWALSRNPAFYNFDGLGGDCTNFVSQCLYAGCGVMNHAPVFGWYYASLNSRTPSWSGVPFLYSFLVSNSGPGPYGVEKPLVYAEPGDVTQLSFDGVKWAHSQLVVEGGERPGDIFLATHTYDSFGRALDTYTYAAVRLIHILGARNS